MTHRAHSLEFKRQVVQEYLGDDTLQGLAKRHDISRQLIRVWIEKYDAGAFDEMPKPLISHSNTRCTSRSGTLVGKQALELEFLKGALQNAPRPRTGTTSVITCPAASLSPRDAGRWVSRDVTP